MLYSNEYCTSLWPNWHLSRKITLFTENITRHYQMYTWWHINCWPIYIKIINIKTTKQNVNIITSAQITPSLLISKKEYNVSWPINLATFVHLLCMRERKTKFRIYYWLKWLYSRCVGDYSFWKINFFHHSTFLQQ